MFVQLRRCQNVDNSVLEAGGSFIESDEVDFTVSADKGSAGMSSAADCVAACNVQFVEAENRFRVAVAERTEFAEILEEVA